MKSLTRTFHVRFFPEIPKTVNATCVSLLYFYLRYDDYINDLRYFRYVLDLSPAPLSVPFLYLFPRHCIWSWSTVGIKEVSRGVSGCRKVVHFSPEVKLEPLEGWASVTVTVVRCPPVVYSSTLYGDHSPPTPRPRRFSRVVRINRTHPHGEYSMNPWIKKTVRQILSKSVYLQARNL